MSARRVRGDIRVSSPRSRGRTGTHFISCESEDRECYDSYVFDEPNQYVLGNWSLQCDTYTTSAFSTPTLRTPTTTIVLPASSNTNACSSIESVCETAYSIEDCYTQFPAASQTAQFKSCACRPDFYSAASVCEYDGNITCFSRPATLARIDLWQACGV